MNGTSSMAPTRRTASGVSGLNLLAGIWLLVSAFVLSFSNLPDARWNNVAVGIAVAIIAMVRMGASNQIGWSWLNAALGIWALVSPWVMGFAGNVTLMWNNVITGAVIAIIGLSSAFTGYSTVPEQP